MPTDVNFFVIRWLYTLYGITGNVISMHVQHWLTTENKINLNLNENVRLQDQLPLHEVLLYNRTQVYVPQKCQFCSTQF